MQNLVLVNELGVLLRVNDSGQYAREEPIGKLEGSREVSLTKLLKLFSLFILRPALRKGEVFIVCENTEILANDIVEVIDHSGDCFDLIGIHLYIIFRFFLFLFGLLVIFQVLNDFLGLFLLLGYVFEFVLEFFG